MPTINLNGLEIAFLEALALIVLACVLVPISRRLGLGTIIGYLVAGALAGAVLSLSYSHHPEHLLHFAEFGVVLFLFVIGLEFRPSRLWELRGTILGRGLVQVLSCGAVLSLAPLLYGLGWQASLVIGLGLALSSTALVMQEIAETHQGQSPYGETAISVLLFEDLAIVPLLLLVAILAPSSTESSLLQNAAQISVGLFAVGLLIAIGRYALNPMFDVIARTRTPELMSASALGVVIGASLLMASVGLSYAMGAFIAGVMLAESSYRHEIEADIEPFRALFLGLFFVAIGLSLDLGVVWQNWALILLSVPVLMLLKGLVIYIVSRVFLSKHDIALKLAFSMSQHGEFGFVLFAAAAAAGLLEPETASIVIAVVTLSMAISSQSARLLALVARKPVKESLDEDYSDARSSLLIIGFGRVGQLVAKTLLGSGQELTLLDNDADRIRESKRFGNRVHFGDATRRDVLKAAGADQARLVIVCVDSIEVIDAVTQTLRHHFNQAQLIVRAHDRIHAIRLHGMGVERVVRETAAGAFEIGNVALQQLALGDDEREQVLNQVRSQDEERLQDQISAATHAKTREAVVASIVPEPEAPARLSQHKPADV